jgi:1-acyl-sn-glycerol-3-phosphate acyltransferase
MTTNKKTNNKIFALYPNTNGFGFVYMENARKLLDFGAVRVNPLSKRKVLERIKGSLDYLRPSIVIVLDPEGKYSRAGSRVKRLVRKIVAYAEEENLTVVQYSRDQIRDVFEQFGARTKYDIAKVLLTEFKELEDKAPKERKLWMCEDRNMAIFDALSRAFKDFCVNVVIS